MIAIHRANPFAMPQAQPASQPAAAPVSSPAAAAVTQTADEAPSFLKNFQSAMASGPSVTAPPAPATVPAMPAATYTGSNGYFDGSAVDARTAASNAMLGALGSNDVKAYQQAAANFLAASPAGGGLPVWASTIAMDTQGNLINTNSVGMSAGMMNPVPGVPNIAAGTADALGNVLPPWAT